MSLQIYLSASALLINLTHKFFWYSNPPLDVVLAQLLCGGAAKEGTKLYCTVLYCTVLYCTEPAEEGSDVDRGVDVEGGVPPAPGEVESLARAHRALQQGHLGSRASRSFTMPGDYPYLGPSLGTVKLREGSLTALVDK